MMRGWEALVRGGPSIVRKARVARLGGQTGKLRTFTREIIPPRMVEAATHSPDKNRPHAEEGKTMMRKGRTDRHRVIQFCASRTSFCEIPKSNRCLPNSRGPSTW